MELQKATLVFSLVLVCASAVTITTFPQTVTLERGQSITLPCVISGTDFNLFTNPLIWYKEIENGYKQINTNIQISEPFQKTERYSVDFKHGGDTPEATAEIPLTIRDATAGDSGIYKCEVGGRSGVVAEVTHRVTVTEPPDFVRLHANRTRIDTNNSSVIILEEGKPGQLWCQSKCGNPEPEMRIFIGSHDVSNDFDKTVVSEPSLDPVGLQYSVHSIKLSSKHFSINTLYQGEKITCVSRIPDTKYTINDSAIIEVHYVPLIFCDKTYFASLGDLHVKLSCKVRAYPPLTHAMWSFGTANLTDSQTLHGFSSKILTVGEHTVAELTISNITNASFIGYTLDVTNSLKSVARTIELVKMEPTTVPPAPPSTESAREITDENQNDKVTTKPHHPPYAITGASSITYSKLYHLLCSFYLTFHFFISR